MTLVWLRRLHRPGGLLCHVNALLLHTAGQDNGWQEGCGGSIWNPSLDKGVECLRVDGDELRAAPERGHQGYGRPQAQPAGQGLCSSPRPHGWDEAGQRMLEKRVDVVVDDDLHGWLPGSGGDGPMVERVRLGDLHRHEGGLLGTTTKVDVATGGVALRQANIVFRWRG